MNSRLLLPFLAVFSSYASALTPDQRSRIAKLENSLLAPCCYSEPVARHRSEVSLAMRAEIQKMVVANKSDREILDLYKNRYGLRVLVEPEGARWWWMHVVPVVAAIVGLGLVLLLLRRWFKPLPARSQ